MDAHSRATTEPMKPPVPDDLDDEQLVRYLRGECSPADVRAIEHWIGQSETRRTRLDLLRRAWVAAGGPAERGNVDRGWAALSAQLDDAQDEAVNRPRVLRIVPVTPPRTRWAIAVRAAGLLLVAGLAGQFIRQAGRDGVATPAGQPGPMREIVTKPGQRADVYLSDGTHVVLGVASRLRFPTMFGATRDVTLQGQAYFDVVHDAARPFAVHTPRAVARDLGTRFDVRAYADSESVEVVVTDGLVVLKPAAHAEAPDSLLLRPTDAGVLHPDGKLTLTRNVDTTAHLAWTSGMLVFQQTPSVAAILQLNRWYGADIRLGDSTLARLTLTATFTDETLAQALDLVADVLGARLERHGATVVLRARRPHR